MKPRPRYKHQKEATAKAVSLGSMGFWMEQRTGKSLAVLDAVEQLNGWPLLILCPYISIPTWQDEFRKENWPEELLQIFRPDGSKNVSTAIDKLGNPTARVFIVNLNIIKDLDVMGIRSNYVHPIIAATGVRVPRFPKAYGLADWKSIILDESYRIANNDNEVTQYLFKWPNQTDQYRFPLSGTPASEHGYNFCTQHIWTHGHFFGCKTFDG